MKTTLKIIFLMLMPASTFSQVQESAGTTSEYEWTIKEARELAEKQNDPEKWNIEMLQSEMENFNGSPASDFPLHLSPFPVPEYETTGNGTSGSDFEIEGKNIISRSALVKRGPHNEFLFTDENAKEMVYFTILTIDDNVENPNVTLASSRNHPHYFAQGSLNSSTKSKVDWIAIQAADQNAYAVVNGKVFDLRVGRVILAAPQKDGSIRFYQSKAGPMSVAHLQDYLNDLMSRKMTINFFTQKGNI